MSRKASRSISIRDVADRAGVSTATVSNVLNRPQAVSLETSERVRRAIDDLGFVRNSLASQLRAGHGTTLGMLVLDIENPFFAALAHACETEADRLGYSVLLGSSNQLPSREEKYLDLLSEQRVAGTLLAPVGAPTKQFERLRSHGHPIVLFGTEASTDYCSVALDGEEGGYLATRHLIASGRRHIAFLGGPHQQVEARWLGAMRACAETGGARLTRIETADTSIGAGRAVGLEFASTFREDRPDAVFAANDMLAFGLVQSLTAASDLHIPRDLAVIGFDDIQYASAAIVPLSTVRQPVEMLAAEAIRLVLEEASGTEHQHESVRLPPTLIERASSQPNL